MSPVVVKRVGFKRVIAVVVLGCWALWHYWINPALVSIDRVTPWAGVVPGAHSCGAPVAPTPVVSGWPALWHDLGALPRKLAEGPPTAAQMRAWMAQGGTESAKAVGYMKDGAAGNPILIPNAPIRSEVAVPVGGALTDQQVAELAARAGWPAAEIPNVVARVKAESTNNPRARDYVDGTHWGLLQLSPDVRAQYIAGQDAFDPLVNLQGARLLWEDRGWDPWKASDELVRVQSVQTVTPCAATPDVLQVKYDNGKIPSAELVAISSGGMLQPAAASAFEQMSAAYAAAFGKPLSVTDSYRDLAGQYACTAAKGSLCARPGTSNHGWGLALDLGGGIQRFGTPQHQWMVANAPQYGWILPSWAQQGGSKPEPWHWEYLGVGAQQAG